MLHNVHMFALKRQIKKFLNKTKETLRPDGRKNGFWVGFSFSSSIFLLNFLDSQKIPLNEVRPLGLLVLKLILDAKLSASRSVWPFSSSELFTYEFHDLVTHHLHIA